MIPEIERKHRTVICTICDDAFSTSKWWCAKFCPDCRDKQLKKSAKINKRKYVLSGRNAWAQIKQRCENPKDKDYRFYGAKGIKLEISLEEFIEFYSGDKTCSICKCKLRNGNKRSAQGKCIDRIDSSKNYSIDNIRLLCRSCNTKTSCCKQKRGFNGRFS